MSLAAFWGRDVEITDFFHGGILNAVDAKGRVSLPSAFRSVIDRRANRDELPDDKIVKIGPHEKFECLQAFDATYSRRLYQKIEQRVGAMEGVDVMSAMDEAQLEAFGSVNDVSYDGGGRMVLSPLLRAISGIEDLAYFVGAGETFQIWNPDAFRTAHADKPRLIRTLDFLMAERGGKA
jgi:MraZ protein